MRSSPRVATLVGRRVVRHSRYSFVLAALLAVALQMVLTLPAAAAPEPAKAPGTVDVAKAPAPALAQGYDISYPQCGKTLPSKPAFGLVGEWWSRVQRESVPGQRVRLGLDQLVEHPAARQLLCEHRQPRPGRLHALASARDGHTPAVRRLVERRVCLRLRLVRRPGLLHSRQQRRRLRRGRGRAMVARR